MRRRLTTGLVALCAVSALTLFGFGRSSGEESSARGASRPVADVGALVEQFTAASSTTVTARLERAAERNPQDGPTVTLLGLAYQQVFRETGDPSWLARAERALERAGSLVASNDVLLLTARSQLAVTQHRFREAIPLARRALRSDPASTAALGSLGDALLETGRYREAFAAFDRLAAAGPSVGAYARVAFARRLLGRPQAAIEAMELALEAGSGIREQSAWALTQYGNLLLSSGRTGDAQRAYRRALTRVPGYVHARAGLARAAVARGDLRQAAKRLQAVVDRLPIPQYAILLGEVLERDGRAAEASRAFGLVGSIERLLAAGGVRTELQTALFDLDRGIRVGDALSRARAAYRAAPSVAAADAVAWGEYRSGRCSAARAWSRKALRLGTRDGLFLFHRGLIERCLGREARSKGFMAQAIAADPQFSVRWSSVARAAVESPETRGERVES